MSTECECSLTQWALGDGCGICNPEYLEEMTKKDCFDCKFCDDFDRCVFDKNNARDVSNDSDICVNFIDEFDEG